MALQAGEKEYFLPAHTPAVTSSLSAESKFELKGVAFHEPLRGTASKEPSSFLS